MRLLLPTLFVTLFAWNLWAQTPSLRTFGVVGEMDHSGRFYTMPNGNVLLNSNARPSFSSDSNFAVVSVLNANLEPLWTRVYKCNRSLFFQEPYFMPNGNIRMLAVSNNTSSKYFNYLVTLNGSNGTLTPEGEIIDSTSATQSSPYYDRLIFSDGSQILPPSRFSLAPILSLNPAGQLVGKQLPGWRGKRLQFMETKALKGNKNWVAMGTINSTQNYFFLRAQDTSVKAFRVIDFGFPTTYEPRNMTRLPNGEILFTIQYNDDILHLCWLDSNGVFLRKKSHKIPNLATGWLNVEPGTGNLFMMGSTSPLVTGVLVKFSPSGNYLGSKNIFELGKGLGRMNGIHFLNPNEIVVTQDFNNSQLSAGGDLLLNQINPNSFNFPCWVYQIQNPLSDTNIVFVDSAALLPKGRPIRFGYAPTVSVPVLSYLVTPSSQPVTCATSTLPQMEEETLALFPNPTRGKLQIPGLGAGSSFTILNSTGKEMATGTYNDALLTSMLPPGLYFLKVAGYPKILRFILE